MRVRFPKTFGVRVRPVVCFRFFYYSIFTIDVARARQCCMRCSKRATPLAAKKKTLHVYAANHCACVASNGIVRTPVYDLDEFYTLARKYVPDNRDGRLTKSLHTCSRYKTKHKKPTDCKRLFASSTHHHHDRYKFQTYRCRRAAATVAADDQRALAIGKSVSR